MSDTTPSRNEDNERVATRIKEALADFSQSEVARTTSIPVYSVNRYLSGRTIPASFCALLVKHFSINPTWLLSGEGPVYQQDVATEVANVTEKVLDLSRMMKSVSKMKFGAIVSQQSTKQLYSLNEALENVEGTQDQLAEQVAPLLETLMGGLEHAAREGGLQSVRELADAARSMLGVSPDKSREMRIFLLEAEAFARFGRQDEASDVMQMALRSAIGRKGPVGRDLWVRVLDYIRMLLDSNHARTALNIVRASRAIIERQQGLAPESASLRLASAWIALELSDTTRAPFRVFSRPLVQPTQTNSVEKPWYVRSSLLTGKYRPEQIREWAKAGGTTSLEMLAFSLATEQKRLRSDAIAALNDARLLSQHATLLLDLARQPETSKPNALRRKLLKRTDSPLHKACTSVLVAWFSRGNSNAQQYLFEAKDYVNALGTNDMMPFWYRVLLAQACIAHSHHPKKHRFLARFPALLRP